MTTCKVTVTATDRSSDRCCLPLFLNILHKWENGETKANANASPESIPSPSLHCLLPMLQRKTQLKNKNRIISLVARMLADNGELLVRLR